VPTPPTKEVILQRIRIIDIEFILFSGDARIYDGPSPTGGTNLTAAEIATNDANITAMANALLANPEYMIILHGHANPVTFTPAERQDLMSLSMDRALAVEAKLKEKYDALNMPPVEPPFSPRASSTWYGGERNLAASSSTYAGLNRRVEMILFTVETVPVEH
jgi:outer membrane protein OmpA-like peptidoglycan-associated protein